MIVRFDSMRAGQRLVVGVMVVAAVSGPVAAAQTLDRRQLERIERTLREEGQAIIALADAAAAGERVPSDFTLRWHNDFLKAQTGTFVPFILSVTGARLPAALLYVRLAARDSTPAVPSSRPRGAPHGRAAGLPVEEIYPVDLSGPAGAPVRVARGFYVPAGEYDLTVVLRERARPGRRRAPQLAAILRRPLEVPDFSGQDLTTSTIMLARGLETLPRPLGRAELSERPYVIGLREVYPAVEPVFRRDEELIVLFLVYNPDLAPDGHFDLQVEYHFFRQMEQGVAGHEALPQRAGAPAARPDEVYFNRTEPQRFNPLVLGPSFEPAAGQPVLAGQGVPLTAFERGDYRLAITVTDLMSRKKVEREVVFTVGS